MKPLRFAPRGFTLIELLVAITVLAVVSLIAWRGLDSLAATRARLMPETDEVRALLATFGQMERDLSQVTPAGFINVPGGPVSVRASTQGPVLQILRLAPPDETGATAVQTVFYRLNENTLVRQAAPATRMLGATEATELSQARLLTDVRRLRVRLWRDGLWVEAAGDVMPVQPQGANVGPGGLEITVERSDGRVYRRVLLVG